MSHSIIRLATIFPTLLPIRIQTFHPSIHPPPTLCQIVTTSTTSHRHPVRCPQPFEKQKQKVLPPPTCTQYSKTKHHTPTPPHIQIRSLQKTKKKQSLYTSTVPIPRSAAVSPLQSLVESRLPVNTYNRRLPAPSSLAIVEAAPRRT